MTAAIQHLPAGVEQKVPSPPPALQPTCHPVYQVSAKPPLPGQTDTKTIQLSFLLTQTKSRWHHGLPEVCNITQSTPWATWSHSQSGCFHTPMRPLLLITSPSPKSPEAVLDDAWRKVLKQHKDQSVQATHQPLKTPHPDVSILSCFVWGQARLLGTLAVSRGLGDHQLKVIDTNIEVKPFLSCIPKVSHSTWEF